MYTLYKDIVYTLYKDIVYTLYKDIDILCTKVVNMGGIVIFKKQSQLDSRFFGVFNVLRNSGTGKAKNVNIVSDKLLYDTSRTLCYTAKYPGIFASTKTRKTDIFESV